MEKYFYFFIKDIRKWKKLNWIEIFESYVKFLIYMKWNDFVEKNINMWNINDWTETIFRWFCQSRQFQQQMLSLLGLEIKLSSQFFPGLSQRNFKWRSSKFHFCCSIFTSLQFQFEFCFMILPNDSMENINEWIFRCFF